MQVDKFIPGGYALATDTNGKKVFLWNALPGEFVTDYRIIKNKSTYQEAIATNINNKSPHRIDPRDACFLSTSPWQILDYNYELSEKQSLVVELFREHGILIDTPEIITDGRDFSYRNKMEYSLYYDHQDEKIHPAFHVRGSHQKIPISTSSIERPEIFAAATEIINNLNKNHDEARRYQSLILRCNQSGQVSGGLYKNHRPRPTFPLLADAILGHLYSYSVNGFFQINLPVYELALKEIKKYVNTDDVLDLYSGVGTIGLSVARDHHLTLVESDHSAYQELKNNSASFPHTTPIIAKSEDALDYITKSQTVILDPPRAGCDCRLINKLLEVRPAKIIYLSCNPATQARDVSELMDKYNIDMVKTFNFFPRTPHIENLIVLS